MSSIGNKIGKRAARATLRHSVRGVMSKAKRQPFRSATLLGTGGVIGVTAGWIAGRRSAGGDSS
jgi:hypothetical protein